MATSDASKIEPGGPVRVIQPQLDAAGGVTLRFDNADIYEVVQTIMGDILHLNYVIDPGVTGKVNINGLTPVSSNDLLGVLQSVLAMNNVSIIRDGNMYKVVRDSVAPHDAVGGAAVGDNGSMIQIFAPKFVQPSAMINSLKNFVGAQAAMVNDPTDHYLIIVDRARNMKKLQELIQSLDVDYLAHVEIEVVQIENDDATDMAKQMDSLFKTSQIFNWRGTEANKVYFMPIKRMNAILIAAANKDILESAKHRIKEIDIPPRQGLGSRINIYVCKNSAATYLASLISQIYGGPAISSSTDTSLSSSASLSQGTSKVVQKGAIAANAATGSGLVGEVQVIPNEKSNSLIIKAGRQDYLEILKLLEQLDSIPRQVLIQANIIEVTLNNTDQLGLEWHVLNDHVKINGTSYTATTSQQGLLPRDSSGNVTGGGLLYTLGVSPQQTLATLQAVASKNDINVLSSPRILASDGKEATIEVGEEVPVLTQEIANVVANSSTTTTNPATTLTSSVTYRSVGLILKIKPSINDSGLVNLALSQEVSNVVDDVNASGNTPRFTKRKIDTEITLQEGKTLTIGGLIQDQRSKSDSGIPFLKDIPLFGSLFKNASHSKQRTELLLTITPYVVRGQDDADRVNQEADDLMEGVKAYTKRMAAEKARLRVTTSNSDQTAN